MKKLILIGVCILLTACANHKYQAHFGQAFLIPFEQTLSFEQLDQQYTRYIARHLPVRLMGGVKFQCKIRGDWAFLTHGDSLVLVDFASSSPNILLPIETVVKPLMIEGYIVSDDTVLNKYRLIPTGFEYQK
jgi:hypothetical protein